MDHQVNNSGQDQPAPIERQPIVERQPFGEQLRAFFRRNALWFLVLALVWLLVQDIFGTHGVLAMHRSQLERDKLQGEIQQIDNENQKLQDNVRDLKSDPTTMERLGREELGLGRKYEQIFKTEQKTAQSH
ncbi:MAG TPA: septum formation initiator family protein [Candidatus Acidoferrales bacterium]